MINFHSWFQLYILRMIDSKSLTNTTSRPDSFDIIRYELKKKKETIHRKITHDSQIDTRYEIESTNENPFDQPTKFNKVSVITWWTTVVIGIVSGMIYIGRGGGRGGLKKQHVSDLTKQDGRLLSVLLSLPKLFPGDSTTTTRKPADSPRRPSPTILLSPSWERERERP